MSVNKFKVGDVVKCIDSGIYDNLTIGKDYVVLDVSDVGGIKVEGDKGSCFYCSSYRFELSKGSANAQQLHKFKVGDVVKCVDVSSINNLTLRKEYIVLQTQTDIALCVYGDNGDFGRYCPSRFELSDSDETSQPPKFKEGDMVYLIGFDCLKPCKLLATSCEHPNGWLKVEKGDSFRMFTENGCLAVDDITPSLVLVTEENRLTLNKLLGVEYEPLKLTGSDLAKKLLKDKPQTCYVSDNSDEHATSRNVVLIMEFENDSFISKGGSGWKFAVPCDQHGTVLEYE